jgi:hypothetical protein
MPINFTNTTNAFTNCVWLKPNPDVIVYAPDDAGRLVIFSTGNNNINIVVDSNPTETGSYVYFAGSYRIAAFYSKIWGYV